MRPVLCNPNVACLATQAAVVAALVAGCVQEKPASSLQAGENLLYEGKPREAIQTLMSVPWSDPEVLAARRLVSDICTRIDLYSQDAGQAPPRVDVVEILGTLPHDPSCFTEGLAFEGDTLLESCGLYGESRIRRVDAGTGALLRERRLDGEYFGEGLTRFGDSVFVLSFVEGTGLVFDADLTRQERSFPIEGEGWGLTHDGTHLVYSNGTNEIRFLDPGTGAVAKTVEVFHGGLPLMNINELEYVDGELLAVIWPTERIARIDPTSGEVLGWILAEGLLPSSVRFSKVDVLNGIAYDPAGKRFFLTGKLWPTTFIVRLKPLSL